jgi:hypothetical protein
MPAGIGYGKGKGKRKKSVSPQTKFNPAGFEGRIEASSDPRLQPQSPTLNILNDFDPLFKKNRQSFLDRGFTELDSESYYNKFGEFRGGRDIPFGHQDTISPKAFMVAPDLPGGNLGPGSDLDGTRFDSPLNYTGLVGSPGGAASKVAFRNPNKKNRFRTFFSNTFSNGR